MTVLPEYPHPPLTVAEYVDLPEDDQYRWELQEGALVMSPSATALHMRAIRRLCRQLEDQLSAEFDVVPDVDVDLRLVPADKPGFVRRPDLVVVDAGTVERTEDEHRLIRAAEVRLIVEIVSPGSVRMDHVTKRYEYAEAGIGHYWIVDLARPASLLACHQAGELGYADNGEFTGTFAVDTPFPVTIDLSALR